MTALRLTLAMLAAAVPAAAGAQSMMDLSTIDLGISQIQQQTFLGQSMMRDMALQREALRPPRGAPGMPRRAPGPAAAAPVPQALLMFSPVAPSIVPAQLAATMPGRRDQYERLFAGFLTEYHGLLRQKGLPRYDCARAAAYLLASLFYIDRGGRDPSEPELAALRLQTRRMLAADANFRRMGARARQELYEGYVIEGSFLSDQFGGAQDRGDARRAAELRAIARRDLTRLLGAPPERVRFTATGLALAP